MTWIREMSERRMVMYTAPEEAPRPTPGFLAPTLA